MTLRAAPAVAGALMVVALLGCAERVQVAPEAVRLCDAARAGETDTVRELLAGGLSANAPGPDGRSALHFAADEGRTDVVELLLGHGARVDAKDADGRTALHLAALNAHRDVMRLLVEWGADVDAEDNRGCTPVDLPGTGQYGQVEGMLSPQRAPWQEPVESVPPWEVWVADVDGGDHERIGEGGWPLWSPDGALLAFVSDIGARNTICVWDGEGIRPVCASPPSLDFAWSADSRSLVVAELGYLGEPRSATELIEVSVEDPGIRRPVQDGHILRSPGRIGWAPEGLCLGLKGEQYTFRESELSPEEDLARRADEGSDLIEAYRSALGDLRAGGALTRDESARLSKYLDDAATQLEAGHVEAAEQCLEQLLPAAAELHDGGVLTDEDGQYLLLVGVSTVSWSTPVRRPVGGLADGRVLLVEEGGRTMRLLVEPADGGTPEPVCELPDGTTYVHWTPDVSRLAMVYQVQETVGPDDRFTRDTVITRSVLAIRDLATGQETDLGDGGDPLWSPDGEWLLYTGPSGEDRLVHDHVLHTVDAHGAGDTVIAEGVLGRFDWAPDSRRVAYSVGPDLDPRQRAR